MKNLHHLGGNNHLSVETGEILSIKKTKYDFAPGYSYEVLSEDKTGRTYIESRKKIPALPRSLIDPSGLEIVYGAATMQQQDVGAAWTNDGDLLCVAYYRNANTYYVVPVGTTKVLPMGAVDSDLSSWLE